MQWKDEAKVLEAIKDALLKGGLVIEKFENNKINLGKTPELVLAELIVQIAEAAMRQTLSNKEDGIERITQYQAKDGTIFATLPEALIYEKFFATANSLKQLLVIHPDPNSSVGIPNDTVKLVTFKNQYRQLLFSISKNAAELWDNDNYGMQGFFIRNEDNPCMKVLRDLWYAFACIGTNGKSYGQPYYAHRNM